MDQQPPYRNYAVAPHFYPANDPSINAWTMQWQAQQPGVGVGVVGDYGVVGGMVDKKNVMVHQQQQQQNVSMEYANMWPMSSVGMGVGFPGSHVQAMGPGQQHSMPGHPQHQHAMQHNMQSQQQHQHHGHHHSQPVMSAQQQQAQRGPRSRPPPEAFVQVNNGSRWNVPNHMPLGKPGPGKQNKKKMGPNGNHCDIEEEISNQSLYKTELCRSYEETGNCRYGGKCQFAHGMDELRPVIRHPKYKTEICKTFHTIGTCPYGKRCRFIHTGEDLVDPSIGSEGMEQQQMPHHSQHNSTMVRSASVGLISPRGQMSKAPGGGRPRVSVGSNPSMSLPAGWSTEWPQAYSSETSPTASPMHANVRLAHSSQPLHHLDADVASSMTTKINVGLRNSSMLRPEAVRSDAHSPSSVGTIGEGLASIAAASHQNEEDDRRSLSSSTSSGEDFDSNDWISSSGSVGAFRSSSSASVGTSPSSDTREEENARSPSPPLSPPINGNEEDASGVNTRTRSAPTDIKGPSNSSPSASASKSPTSSSPRSAAPGTSGSPGAIGRPSRLAIFENISSGTSH